jgi:hypothetical protein
LDQLAWEPAVFELALQLRVLLGQVCPSWTEPWPKLAWDGCLLLRLQMPRAELKLLLELTLPYSFERRKK